MSGFLLKDFLIPKNGSGRSIQAQQAKRSAVVRRGSYVKSIVEDDRRRPSHSRNRRLPGDIRGRAPFQGNACFMGYPLSGRPAKTRPVLSEGDAGLGGYKSCNPADINKCDYSIFYCHLNRYLQNIDPLLYVHRLFTVSFMSSNDTMLNVISFAQWMQLSMSLKR